MIRGWHMLRWVCLSFSRKKSWRKESKMFLESKSRLFFLVKQKLPNPQSFFFYRKQQKVEKLQRNNISCQLTTFLSSQFASFFHIFIFLKRKQPFTCDSYLKKNNQQFLTPGVILRFFRAHTHMSKPEYCDYSKVPLHPRTIVESLPKERRERLVSQPKSALPQIPRNLGGNFF